MLALLALLETDERNNNRPINENDDVNLALYYRMMHGNTDPLQDEPNDGEWWNDLIEPSVQYYGNSHRHNEQNPRDRRLFKGRVYSFFSHNSIWLSRINFFIFFSDAGDFPAKRFMISKKKRSLGMHKADHFFDGPLKSKVSSGFDSRYSVSQRF